MPQFARPLAALLAVLCAGLACSEDDPVSPIVPCVSGAQQFTFTKVDSFPHSDSLFTQGFFYDGGFFYEGTGGNGTSTVRKIDPMTGNTLLRANILLFQRFGEGIAMANGMLVQLTWQERRAYRYQFADFALVDSVFYTTEGWGLTYDGMHFIMSAGTDTLHFRDPTDFSEVRRIVVSDSCANITLLNELEYINGEIYANVLPTDQIAIINPTTGRVRAWIDCSGIVSAADRGASPDNVMNGIAYDAVGDRLFVTGKRWRKVYEIDLVPK